MNETIQKGVVGIQLEMTGVTPQEIAKLNGYFVRLVEAQVHRMKNGSMTLHFDSDGNLSDIDINRKIWKRKA